MKYRVEVTERAERDVDTILAWLSERSAQGAAAWFDAWLKACAFLAENAEAASLAPEDSDHQEEIRHWPFKTASGHRYRALLLVRDNVVFVLNVRGTGQRFVSKADLGKPNQ